MASLPKPLIFIVISYYVASATACQLHDEEVCMSNINITTPIMPPIDPHISLRLPMVHLKNTTSEILLHWAPATANHKLPHRMFRKRAADASDKLRCGDPVFTFSDTTDTWVQIVLHGLLGFLFGTVSTIAVGFMSAMWWYTTSMATRKAKNEERKIRLEEITYRNQQGCDECEQSPMCPICLDDFPDLADLVDWPVEKGSSARGHSKTLLCGHRYHNICIGEWLQRNDSCPICRLDHPVPSSPKHWSWSWRSISCKAC